MGLNFLTDYPLGIIRLIPVFLHRLVEFASPGMFVAIPWVFFSDAGMMPIISTIVGAGIILNAALTRPVQAVCAMVVLLSIVTLPALVEGKSWAKALEGGRLLTLPLLVAVLLLGR